MMYCSKCGKEVSSSDKICKSCGATLFGHEITDKGILETWNIEEWFTKKRLIRFFEKLVLAMFVMLAYVLSKEFSAVNFSVWNERIKLPISEFLQYVIELLNISGQTAGGAQFCYFLFRIGIFIYIGMVILAFAKREEIAMVCGIVGFICNLAAICYIPKGIEIVAGRFLLSFENWDVGKTLGALEDSFFVYVILNIVILICSVRFFYNYSGKVSIRPMIEYSVDKNRGNAAKEMPGEWCCKKCGEKNESFMRQCCVCGTEKQE